MDRTLIDEKIFANYEVSKTLKDLGFTYPCHGRFSHYPPTEMEVRYSPMDWNNNDFSDTMSCPMWHQIDQYLWQKHQIWIYRMRGNKKNEFTYRIIKDETVLMELNSRIYYTSPFTAKIEGTKKAIQYLFKQSQTK